MNDLINFLTTKEVAIVLGILGLVFVLYLSSFIYELLKKHKQTKKLKNNTAELKKLVEEVEAYKKTQEPTVIAKEDLPKVEMAKIPETNTNQEVKVEPLNISEKVDTPSVVEVKKEEVTKVESKETAQEKKEPIVTNNELGVKVDEIYHGPVEVLDVNEPVTKKKEEQVQYKEEVYTKEEAKEELSRLVEELKKENEEEQDQNIELTSFEEEQEENAIISLQELLQKGPSLTAYNEVSQYQDDGNEPISITELEQRYQEEKNKANVTENVSVPPVETKEESVSLYDFYTAPTKVSEEPVKKYVPSPIISPIFGIEKPDQDQVNHHSLELENTANYEKLDEEIRKTNEFLAKLKELKGKLD